MRNTGFVDKNGEELFETDLVEYTEFDGSTCFLVIEMSKTYNTKGERVDFDWAAMDHRTDGESFGGGKGIVFGVHETPLCNDEFRNRMVRIGPAKEYPELYQQTQPLLNLQLL